jgi:ubiquinone/menaquinone biosynthesis C-methylase UbiE
MEELLAGLRAAGEATRLRLLRLLSLGEFNVSEITRILGHSQPRVSRHLKLMVEAGLLERYKEGSWVLFRLAEQGRPADLARAILALLPADDPVLERDRARLDEAIAERHAAAMAYFSANAAIWDEIRSLHIAEGEVEAAMRRMVGDARVGLFLDLGTGTGRVLQLFAPLAEQAVGIDQSRDMLAVARANLELAHERRAQVRHGDIMALPFPAGSADLVTIHQVLHYLDDPARALQEAARVLAPSGRLLIVDFAPHELEFLREEHAHRRLGIADEAMEGWLRRAGLETVASETLSPPASAGPEALTVRLWLVRPAGAHHSL